MKNIEFKGSGSEYFKIWIVNVLLSIITLGIYYPWAKVRNKRYFYANTGYDNRFFDYHATGKQLLLGYLIGVGILILLNIIVNFAPGIGAILFIVLFLVVPWIIWRSLKFNMRTTSFSNVRFSFNGELNTAYFVYLFLPVVGYLAVALLLFGGPGIALIFSDTESQSLMTIGSILTGIGGIAAIILAAYLTGLFEKKSTEYQLGQTKYGQGRFITQYNTGKFVKISVKTYLIILGFMILLGIIFALSMVSFTGGFDTDSMVNDIAVNNINPLLVIIMALIYFGFIATFIFAATYAYSRKRQYIYDNTTLDKVINFKSTVKAKHYFFIIITNMLMVLFTLGLATPWAKVRVARYLAQNTFIEATEVDFNSYLTQKEAEQSAIAEEIGDALDVGIDIAI